MDTTSPKASRSARRPTRYSKILGTRICQRLASGQTLSQICEDPKMPVYSVLRRWQDQEPGFLLATLRARQSGNEVLAEECLRIADDPLLAASEKRVRIDTRMKLIGKWTAAVAQHDAADLVETHEDEGGLPGLDTAEFEARARRLAAEI